MEAYNILGNNFTFELKGGKGIYFVVVRGEEGEVWRRVVEGLWGVICNWINIFNLFATQQ